MLPNLLSSDLDKQEETRMFLCVVCQNLPIPKFTLGAKGLNANSVKLSMCGSCNGLACYNCWQDLLEKVSPSCPKCR